MVAPAGAASMAAWIDSPEWTTSLLAPAVEPPARVSASARVQAARGVRASLGLGFYATPRTKAQSTRTLASWSALEDLSPGVVSVPEGFRHEEARRRRRPFPTTCRRPRSAPYPLRNAASTCSGCFAASLTRAQCLRTLPSGPIHTVERMTPTVFLPYIIFSP